MCVCVCVCMCVYKFVLVPSRKLNLESHNVKLAKCKASRTLQLR